MQKVTAVFDIGRTNKKFFLFDADFQEVHREYTSIPFTKDEDGFPTENLPALQAWLGEVFGRILTAKEYDVSAINFSAYGASFVHLDDDGNPLTPLYNYEKPVPAAIEEEFYATYGPQTGLEVATGSTRSGMLNSGLQLFWLKRTKPEVFAKIRYSLHLPQYLSYVFTGIPLSEYTSIGCHTSLWDYAKKDYHPWVYSEGLNHILPPIVSTETSINLNFSGKHIKIGVGIHDSSGALLPYLRGERKPFLLISTGTWSVSLNPFTTDLLTEADLEAGCINYMRIDGKAVKAARLFLGEEYKRQTAVLADHFGVPKDTHKTIHFDQNIYQDITTNFNPWFCFEVLPDSAVKATTILTDSYDYAYHHLMVELVNRQVASLRAAMGEGVNFRKLYIDGGFSDNDVYVKLLAHHFRAHHRILSGFRIRSRHCN